MQRTIAVIAILVLIALTGCTAGQSPEARFAELKAKQATSTYHVSYTLSSGALSDEGAQFLEDAGIDTYSRGPLSKTVVQITLLGQTATVAEFREGNRSVTCREGGAIGAVSCQRGEESRLDLTDHYTRPGTFHLNLSGTRTVAGRTCQMFTARPNSSDIDTGVIDPANARMEICLDTGKGYLALLRINATEDSELADDTSRNVLTLRATSHEDTVTADAVTPPLPVIVAASCGEGTVTITPLHDIDTATVAVDGENTTATLGARYTTTTVDIGQEALTAAGEATVHTAAGSQTARCRTGSLFEQLQ